MILDILYKLVSLRNKASLCKCLCNTFARLTLSRLNATMFHSLNAIFSGKLLRNSTKLFSSLDKGVAKIVEKIKWRKPCYTCCWTSVIIQTVQCTCIINAHLNISPFLVLWSRFKFSICGITITSTRFYLKTEKEMYWEISLWSSLY